MRWSWRGDPAVPAFPDDDILVVFDGECVLCSANAQLILKHDRHRRFRLTTAQGPLGQGLYRHFGRANVDSETMLVIRDGWLLTQSDGMLAMAESLGWPWRLLAIGKIVPRSWRDAAYRLVARNRFRLFGRRAQCWAPTAEVRERIV
jgi:predicted DCC family thiol-disulfide oxidoreductase YuxK